MPGPFTYPTAEGVPFDGTIASPPFFSENVQDAIEEARNSAAGTPRYALPLTFNGTINNGSWIGYSEVIPGDTSPILFPSNCFLEELTFTNVRSDADFSLELYKNGQTAAEKFYTISKTNIQYFDETGINEAFSAGDIIYIKYIDDGTNALDVVIVLFLRIVL